MRKLTIELVACMLFICSISVYADWEKVELDYRESKVYNSYTLGEYQFVRAPYEELFRRSLDDDKWELVLTGQYQSYLGHFFLCYGRLYCGDYASDDSGKTWFESNDFYMSNYSKIVSIGEYVVTFDYLNDLKFSKKGLGETVWHKCKGVPDSLSLYNLSKGKENLFLSSWGKVWVSNDSGATWHDNSSGLPERKRIYDVYEYSDDVLFASTSEGIYRSETSGTTWELFHDQFNFVNKLALTELTGNDSIFYGYADSVLFQFSDNGEQVMSITLPDDRGLQLGSFEIDKSNIYIAGVNGLWYSNDFGVSWKLLNEGLEIRTQRGEVAISGDSILVVHHASTYQGFPTLSIDKGGTWKEVGVTEEYRWPYFVNDTFIIDTIQKLYIYNDTLYRLYGDFSLSTDFGKTWEVVYKTSKMTGCYDFAKKDSTIILLFSAINGFRSILCSYDNGKSFSSNAQDGFLDEISFYKEDLLLANDRDQNYKLLTSDDFGLTWEDFNPQCTIDLGAITVKNDIFFSTGFYEGNDQEYLYSIDYGKNWHQLIKTDDIAIPLEDMELAFDDSQVAIYNERELTAVYIKSYEELIGESPVLTSQNVDNTAFYLHAKAIGNNVNISFPVQKKSAYELTLFNLQGRQLQTQKGVVSAGTKEIILQNLSIAKGAYIVELQMGDQKRVELIRM